MSSITIQPARNLAGAMRPPGDKSISHRRAILASLGAGPSRLENYATGADCQSTLACLRALGVEIHADADGIAIAGVGLHGLRAPAQVLDAGNSGSTIRMLSGVLASQTFATEIGGDASLSRRPMRRVMAPLTEMGARIESAGGCPPLRFAPATAGLSGIRYTLPVASAQVKSAILLAGLWARGSTTVIEPTPTRDHTEIALANLGVPVQRRNGEIMLPGGVESLAAEATFRVPGDPSSAAFFLCAAAMFPEGELLIDDVSLNPTRSALLDVLARMGACVEMVSVEDRSGELSGSLSAGGWKRDPLGIRVPGLRGTTIAGAEAVALIDEIPILAVLATAAEGGLSFRDVGELRVKESDRIAAIAANLRAMGAECRETETGLDVPGPQRLRGARVASRGDHRIAMAFAVAALSATGDTEIDEPECAGISYPEFFATLDRLAER